MRERAREASIEVIGGCSSTASRFVVTALLVAGFVAFDIGGGARTPPAAAGQIVSAEVCGAGRDAAALDTLFFSEPGGVIGADYQRAFALPDGRVLWTFQDAAVRLGSDEIAIVHSIAVIQSDRCFVIMYRGFRATPQPYFFAGRTVPFERWFWPLDAELTHDGRVAVFTAEVVERGAEYLTHTVLVATWIAFVDPTTGQVVDERSAPDPSADLDGWSVTSDRSWTYLDANCYRQFGFDEFVTVLAFDRPCSTEVTVARVPRGQVSTLPEYWDGIRWQPDRRRPAPIIEQEGRRVDANQFSR